METETPKLLPAETQGTTPAASQQTVKEIQAVRDRMLIARGYPRDASQSQARIAQSCKRPSFAEAAIYKVPRSGGTVEGPSIQLALEVARQWGNMDICMGREIPQDDDKKTVIEVSATDTETNFHVSEMLSVKHVRYSKQGGLKPLTNPDDIYLICSARASKRVRECILKVVPRDVTDLAIEQCRQTSASNAGLELRVAGMVAKFAKLGVTESMLTDHLKKPLKDIVAGDLQDLAGIYTDLNEGGNIAEHFGNHTDRSTGEVTVVPEVVAAADIPKVFATIPDSAMGTPPGIAPEVVTDPKSATTGDTTTKTASVEGAVTEKKSSARRPKTMDSTASSVSSATTTPQNSAQEVEATTGADTVDVEAEEVFTV